MNLTFRQSVQETLDEYMAQHEKPCVRMEFATISAQDGTTITGLRHVEFAVHSKKSVWELLRLMGYLKDNHLKLFRVSLTVPPKKRPNFWQRLGYVFLPERMEQ